MLKTLFYDLALLYLIYVFDLDTSAPTHLFLLLRLLLSAIGRVLLHHYDLRGVRFIRVVIGFLLDVVGLGMIGIDCLVGLPH